MEYEHFPGKHIDPRGQVRAYIKIGWSLIGAFFTIALAGVILERFGLIAIPEAPVSLDYARGVALLTTILNIGAWMYFPLADLEIQRRWIRSSGAIFPGGTTEFFMIFLALIFLLATIICSLVSPLALAIAGFAVYIWNFIGYAYISKELRRIIRESHNLYNNQDEPGRGVLLRGLTVVEHYFRVAENTPPIRNRQQIRHLLIALSFLVSCVLAVIGQIVCNSTLLVMSYYWSAISFLGGEVCIGIWRAKRDSQLRLIEEEWRRTIDAHE